MRIIQFDSLLFVSFATKGYRTFSWIVLFSFDFSQVQKLHSYTCTLIKAPPPMRPPCKQTRPLQRSLIGCKVHATRLFLSFLADCYIHFLTLINNLVAISQRAKTARKPEHLHLFVSVVSELHRFSECKVIKYKPHTQIFYVKKY